MGLRRFLLDSAVNEARDTRGSESSFIYLDEEGRINAWITSNDENNTSTLKAFKESTVGTMALLDLIRPDLPIKILGIESNGYLVAATGQGTLRYRCTNGKITGLADTSKTRDRQAWDADSLAPPILFPGMHQSDCFSCGELFFSRHETIAKSPNGDPFFPQSLLLVRSESAPYNTHSSQQWIAVGNSQFDKNLRLISCAEKQLFDIPIINFVVDNPRPDGPIMLIGWNRKSMQVIRMDQSATDQEALSAPANKVFTLEDCLLEDISKPWIHHQGRISFWRDLTNPGQFYTWHRD
jgi:hypothetical protein